MLKRSLFAATVLAIIGLVACNGGGGTTVVTTPTPGPTCGPIVTSQLIYPAPGATVAAANTTELVIAVSAPLQISTYNLSLTNTANANNVAQTANFLAQISASQLPAGSATATIPNPTYEAVTLVAPLTQSFASGTQLQTAINQPNSSCTPQTVPGTFTIQ